jgi:hypothetical protein
MRPSELSWYKVGFLNIDGEDDSGCCCADVWKMLQDSCRCRKRVRDW